MPFISDAHNLISAATGWITGLAVAGGGLMVAYHAVLRNFEEDPSRVAHHNQSMKKVLLGTVIAGGAGGIVAAFGKFFGL